MASRWRGTMLATGRCPVWETRLVRVEESSIPREPRQVRCMEEKNHDGPCNWRGIPFGREATGAGARKTVNYPLFAGMVLVDQSGRSFALVPETEVAP